MELRRTVRYYYLKFVRMRGNPRTLALGVAIGVFIGVTPTIPFHTIIILLLAFLFRASKVAALLASVVVSNPLTFFIQYYAAWWLGKSLLQMNLSWANVREIVEMAKAETGFVEIATALAALGRETLLALLVGGLVIAFPIALACYFLALRFFTILDKKRLDRQMASA